MFHNPARAVDRSFTDIYRHIIDRAGHVRDATNTRTGNTRSRVVAFPDDRIPPVQPVQDLGLLCFRELAREYYVDVLRCCNTPRHHQR